MEAINKVFPRLICHLWSVTPFSGCYDVIPVLQPHVHQRSYWDGLALNFLLKRHLSKVEEKCVQYNQRWAVELSGSVGWQKLHLKAFGTKNLDPPNPQPVRSLLQPITLLLVGLADLASAVCPSCPSIRTSIHSSLHFIHPSIHPSIHTFYRPIQKIYPAILSRRLAKRWFSVWTQPTRQDEVFFEGSTCQQAFASLTIYSEKIWIFVLWRKTLQNPTTSQL